MIIGLIKEIKNNENRVGLTPIGVNELICHGHRVLVERGAGSGSGFEDAEYAGVGAEIYPEPKDIFDIADIIVKVKEPLESEYDMFRPGQILYTYLHLASNPELTRSLLSRQVTAIAFETVQLPGGQLPLLAPMSEVAGRMSVQIGATLLQKVHGGKGILLSGVPGVSSAEVVIIGGGVVGTNAVKMALGLGARVTVLDVNKNRLVYLDDVFGGRVRSLQCNDYNVAEAVRGADLLIGAVLIAGAAAPKIVKESMVKTMSKGSVVIDVAIDQGGSIETIDRVTTHDNPCYEKHGVVHYSVANMPGAVPRTSTLALEMVTLPYLIKIANAGIIQSMVDDPSLLAGLNTFEGKVTCRPVAESLGMSYAEPNRTMFRCG